MAVLDIMDRNLQPGDFVVFYNDIYQVKSIPVYTDRRPGMVTIMSINPSKTTRPVKKYSKDMCLLNKDEVLFWMLKRGYVPNE